MIHCRAPCGGQLAPALGIRALAKLACEIGEVELITVEQTVQAHRGVMVCRAAEWTEVEVDVEA
jgi:hypothetical protein